MRCTCVIALSVSIAIGVLLGVPTVQAEKGAQPEKKDEIEVGPILVVGEPPKPLGTGTLHLDQESSSASRLGLTFREIPATVEVIDTRTIQERGLRSISEAINTTGLLVNDAPGAPANFIMRGFSDNQIRQLFDGLLVGPANMVSRPRDTWNLERIEILKGPAAVLYGEGAVAGAIDFVTKRPSWTAEGTEAAISYGTFNTVRAGVGSGGALVSEKLRYRVDLSYQNANNFTGVQRSPYTYWNVTSGLLYHATPRLNFELSFDFAYDWSRPYFGTPLVPLSFAGLSAVDGVVSTRDGRAVDDRFLRQNFNTDDGVMTSTSYWAKWKTNWHPTDLIDIRNQAYYYSADRHWANAETYTFNSATSLLDRDRLFVDHHQYILGDRFTVHANHPILGFKNRLVIGGDFSYVRFGSPLLFNGVVDSVSPFSPTLGVFGSTQPRTEYRTAILTTAIFVEEQLSVTDSLKIVGGVRTDRIQVDRASFDALGMLHIDSSLTKTFTPTTWRAGVVYDITPVLTLYGQYATAADPVGSNIFALSRENTVRLATGDQWELGVKGDFWSRRVEWTAAYFDISRRNIQIPTSPITSSTIGRQRSHGVEVSLAVRPAEQWRIQGNVSWLSARFEDFNEVVGTSVVSRAGNRPQNIPQLVWNLWSVYRFETPVPMDVGAAFRFVGDRYGDNANSIQLHSYETVDAWVAIPYRQFTITLRGRNLFDKTYATALSSYQFDQLLIGAPRTFEVSLMARF